MLQKYLDRFNNEPFGPLLPATGSRFFNTLVSIGAVFPAKRAMRTQCRLCRTEALRHVWSYDDFTLVCLVCGGQVIPWDPLYASQVREDWLPIELSKQLANVESIVLLPNRVWRLATVPIRGKNVSVYLLRCVWTEKLDATKAVIEADPAERQVLLTTKRVVPIEMSGHGRWVIPLVDVARIDREGLVASVDRLESQIASFDPNPDQSNQTRRWFQLSDDGSVLRVQGQELSLHRKQRAFVLAIAEAHDAGERRPNQSSVLKRAGYSRRNTSLSQICRRKEFARFIDWKNGEVAIREHPLPLTRTDGEDDQ